MKIIHIISSLDFGGAEKVLFNICNSDMENEHIIVSLTQLGEYGRMLKKKKISVYVCNMKSKIYFLSSFFYLISIIKKYKPDIVQTWMYHGDFLGSIAARLAGVKKIVWGIRHTNLKFRKSKFTTILISRVLAKLSWSIPKLIIVCAKSAMNFHQKIGYDRKKMCLINNGYDLSIFKNNRNKKNSIRKFYKIDRSTPLLATVGRYTFEKDHENLFKALKILKTKNYKFRYLLIGPKIDYNNVQLVSQIKKYKLENIVILLGIRRDIPLILKEIDLHILSSNSEAFPNVVAEAMACGTPCVVTDVGDARFIVGKTGWVAPPNNSFLLSNSIKHALSELGTNKWKSKSNLARLRIKKNFDIENMINAYKIAWSKIM